MYKLLKSKNQSSREDNDQLSTTTSSSMSISYPNDCFSHLLCDEDSGILSDESPEYSSEIESPTDTEESVAELIEEETKFVPGFDYLSRFHSPSLDVSARQQSVAWILRVQGYYGFQPLTAYLAVNYMDRFLYYRRLPEENGWPMQLLSVACLSVAAKMEEPLVPSLLDIQVESAKYIFEPKTVLRMELLVLSVLDWRLRSITPFSFISFFACKLDPTATYFGFLFSRTTEIILSNIQETNFLEYSPSCFAAAAVLSAANEIPVFSLVTPENAESWCEGLSKEKIAGCYHLMQESIVVVDRRKKSQKYLQQVRVTTRATLRSSESSSSSSSSPSKRRRLNNSLWVVDDDKGNNTAD